MVAGFFGSYSEVLMGQSPWVSNHLLMTNAERAHGQKVHLKLPVVQFKNQQD